MAAKANSCLMMISYFFWLNFEVLALRDAGRDDGED
jgi:hypothetical protein